MTGLMRMFHHKKFASDVLDCPWEKECKERIEKWSAELKILTENRNTAGMEALKKTVEAHLALADFKIKFRQADHVKSMMWGSMVLSPLVGFLGVLVGAWLKK